MIRKLKSVIFYRTREVIPDMLRYDIAFVNDKKPGIVAYPTYSIAKQGTSKGIPTFDRWSSFGAGHERIPITGNEEAELKESFMSDPWYTLRMPGAGRSPEEINKDGYVVVSVQQFFEEDVR
jgi:hypothetical protein